MKAFFSFIKLTLIGGLFLLLPIFLLVLVLEKVIMAFRAFVAPIVEILPIDTIGGIAVHRLIAFTIIVLLCFLAGLLARTKIAIRIKDWIEDHVLSIIPGYTFLKDMGETMAGLKSNNLEKVVLIDLEETWQIGFLVEEIDSILSTVYIPGAPNPLAGNVVFVKKERLKILDMKPLDAMRISNKLGVGTKKKLEGLVDHTMFEEKR